MTHGRVTAQQMGGAKSRGFAEVGGESRGHQGHTVGAVNSFYCQSSQLPCGNMLVM